MTLVGLLAVGCRAAAPTPAATTVSAPAAAAATDTVRRGYSAADVRFLQGMIAHHAQALLMTRWAASHGAGQAVRTLAERIDVSQRDEIAFMQRWLRERGEAVPAPSELSAGSGQAAMAGHEGHAMPAGESMPGMLSAEQLRQLDAARGAEFDRLFLTFMIQHHEGAITMVHRLFATPGAGQEASFFRFASDVETDQAAEIARMRTLLASLPGASTGSGWGQSTRS